ncbi:hydroxymethylbilane synthase [Tengunoibacter tsumagoiensis]|uniref:Hydroxymethylbilane synthase n=1 Tax=Tengunoibacter tsumagoiensis TaxID=2014871 RepID=A0A402A1S6_9CHLR|nr:hydroxymethylbilane synthase [Tengunoibacter tsumagoiensis]GCE13108.1 porphobilinogen deaminase [Tengunoibacter tsumagoiensis]
MIQTQWVTQQLRQQWPSLEIEIVQIHTTGDRVTNLPLSQIGGDGVFVTEIEHALHEGRIDLAVHSLKDLPTQQPDDLCVLVVGEREDVRDIFVTNQPFTIADGRLFPNQPDAKLSVSPRIGTCSLRRTAQIREFLPQAQILSLRGNVDTRLRKLEAGEYDGIVLAAAGLHRLDFVERLAGRMTYFPLEMMLPAPGQGALGVECRNEPELLRLLAPLQNQEAQAATSVERTFMRHLGAGCYLPVAAAAQIRENVLSVQGLVISLDGERKIRVQQSLPWTSNSTIADAEALGVRLAEEALTRGADRIIQEIIPIREQVQSHV